MTTLNVIGLGYIGLPTAAFFANAGVRVIGVDISQKIVDSINSGVAPFTEQHFDSTLKLSIESGTSFNYSYQIRCLHYCRSHAF